MRTLGSRIGSLQEVLLGRSAAPLWLLLLGVAAASLGLLHVVLSYDGLQHLIDTGAERLTTFLAFAPGTLLLSVIAVRAVARPGRPVVLVLVTSLIAGGLNGLLCLVVRLALSFVARPGMPDLGSLVLIGFFAALLGAALGLAFGLVFLPAALAWRAIERRAVASRRLESRDWLAASLGLWLLGVAGLCGAAGGSWRPLLALGSALLLWAAVAEGWRRRWLRRLERGSDPRWVVTSPGALPCGELPRLGPGPHQAVATRQTLMLRGPFRGQPVLAPFAQVRCDQAQK